MTDTIQVAAQAHPLELRGIYRSLPVGATVADIVQSFDLKPEYGLPAVRLIRGTVIQPVPLSMWHLVRPKPGTRVEVHYHVQGPAVAALASMAVTALAPTVAGALGFATGTFAYSLAVSAITVVGGLLINALIPPPRQTESSETKDSYTITGLSNGISRYGVVPKVLGRHRMYPPRSAIGYSETVGNKVYYRGRMMFGWGPLALEDLRIGTTPITEFDNVELELLNVDRAVTEANIPGLLDMNVIWRSGEERMTIYPDDVAEDPYNVKLVQYEAVTRTTRERTQSAAVDITFPKGLGAIAPEGDVRKRSCRVSLEYRLVGNVDWSLADANVFDPDNVGAYGHWNWSARKKEQFRRTMFCTFPVAGEYELRVTKQSKIRDLDGEEKIELDDQYLTAIRSFRAGELPSHDGVAEVAFRIKASDQLSGQIDTLNATVQQMAPTWDGSAWSAPQPVRHPAWIFADMLRGGHMESPVADHRIDLDTVQAWAEAEPHWTCDTVIDTETRIMDALDLIAPAGRARFGLVDLRYSVIRETPEAPVRQVFTPRNSADFRGSLEFPREVHALRCLARSERLEWEQDEVIVYADGYTVETATKFETLDLPTTVITSAEENQGNVYRLGRYHLAQSRLRPEIFTWRTGLEHLRVTRGDKVRFVHDVPSIHIGAGRIRSIDGTSLWLDDSFAGVSGDFRLIIRMVTGDIVERLASRGSGSDAAWTMTGELTGVAVGDLVAIEAIEQESVDLIVTGIFPGADEEAEIRAVPAAPAVLTADQGTIPAYAPVITGRTQVGGPPVPAVQSVTSDETTMIVAPGGEVWPRIAVYLAPLAQAGDPGTYAQIRWADAGLGDIWEYGPTTAIGEEALMTSRLDRGAEYVVQVRSISGLGQSRGWVDVGTIIARTYDAAPPPVEALTISPAETQARVTWRAAARPDIAYAEVRFAGNLIGGNWQTAQLLERVPWPGTHLSVFAQPGIYLLKWVDRGGRESEDAASVTLTPSQVAAVNAVEFVEMHPTWDGSFDGTVLADGAVRLAYDGTSYPTSGTWTQTDSVDLGAVYPCRVTATLDGYGSSLTGAMSQWTSLAEVESLTEVRSRDWRGTAQAATSSDGSTWTAWTEVTGGNLTGRYFKFRLVLETIDVAVTPVISALSVTIDMPDRVEGVREIDAPSTGYSVTFDPAFHNVPAVVITTRDAASGTRWEISSKTRTGFDVQFYDAAGSPVAATFDFVARGYGREQ